MKYKDVWEVYTGVEGKIYMFGYIYLLSIAFVQCATSRSYHGVYIQKSHELFRWMLFFFSFFFLVFPPFIFFFFPNKYVYKN